NGALPAAGFTYTSVTDNSVTIASSGVTVAGIATLQRYVNKLSAITNPTAAQKTALASYQARLADYQARYAAGVDFRAGAGANIKTTYSRVPPSATFEAGWHYHSGPVIVTVTVGTLTFYDSKCGTWDLAVGHSYVESPGQVVNAKVLPDKNTGIANVEWFTTRIYPAAGTDPIVVPAPCTPS
ncbi:MAG: hypothetical protein QOJ75_1952, partial [Chloroflexota bacterium]|nr:hypothetical protein [Chloroflexota bacterium]